MNICKSDQNKILYFLIPVSQSTLQKSHENSVSIIFQFHVIKFNQKHYFSFSLDYTGLYAGQSAKETFNNFSC